MFAVLSLAAVVFAVACATVLLCCCRVSGAASRAEQRRPAPEPRHTDSAILRVM